MHNFDIMAFYLGRLENREEGLQISHEQITSALVEAKGAPRYQQKSYAHVISNIEKNLSGVTTTLSRPVQ
jgi:hypothetical protein